MTKTLTIEIISILTIMMLGGLTIDNAYSDENYKLTELQKKCQEIPENPDEIKPECELLNMINDLQEDQAIKNSQIDALIKKLQEKDSIIMLKDKELEEKNSSLTAELLKLSTEFAGFFEDFFGEGSADSVFETFATEEKTPNSFYDVFFAIDRRDFIMQTDLESLRLEVDRHTVDTNAETMCDEDQFLDGGGKCVFISSNGISCKNQNAINGVIPDFVISPECDVSELEKQLDAAKTKLEIVKQYRNQQIDVENYRELIYLDSMDNFLTIRYNCAVVPKIVGDSQDKECFNELVQARETVVNNWYALEEQRKRVDAAKMQVETFKSLVKEIEQQIYDILNE